MTAFMLRVRALLDGEEAAPPRLAASAPRSRAAGTHRQGEVRALAEQLVCEANAVLAGADLAGPGRRLELTDEPADGHLAFTIRCGSHWARVLTALEGGRAIAHLEGGPPGSAFFDGRSSRELADDEEVAGLVLGLLAVPT